MQLRYHEDVEEWIGEILGGEGSGLSIIVARSEITKKTAEGLCKEI
jgi:hypothetical protein